MDLTPGVHEVTVEEAIAAAMEGARAGAKVFLVSTAGASNGTDFFEAVRASIPLDPPLIKATNWNALADSLWNGIDGIDTRTVVISWVGSADLRETAPGDFSMAITVLSNVASSLGSWKSTDGEPKDVCVYIS